jgi:hypothetical protein
MPVRRSRHILRQLILELAINIERAGAAVPVDPVIMDSGKGVRRRRAGLVRAGFAGDDGLVGVPESAAGCVAGVDVGLRFGGAQEFDVGFLVVGFVEENS